MKKYINISVIVILFTLVSCEDFLEPTPYSFTAPQNFYQNPEQAEIALNGIYHILSAGRVQGAGNNSSFSRGLLEILNTGADETGSQPNRNFRPTPYVQGTYEPTENGFEESWLYLYAGINRANYLIENIQNIPDEDFSGNRKVQLEAEARFLRGFFHMTLSMMYGAIPVYTTSLHDPEAARNSVQEVYDLVLSDYQFAYENLEDRAPILGHANKWTVGGYLVKVHTYLASIKMNGLDDLGFAKNNFDWVDADANYILARDISAEIYNNSGYILTQNYDYLFRESTRAAQYEEFLLGAEASLDVSLNVTSVMVNSFYPQGNARTMGGGSGWMRPLSELYNKYVAEDFRRDYNVSGNLGGNRNGRELVEYEGVPYFEPNETDITAGSVSIGKYRRSDPALKSVPPWASGNTVPLLRYADILLLRAEALYFTGDEAGARELLTEVRERIVIAPATVEDLNAAYFKADFVEELLEERSRELCFEMWRKIDLVRFNVLEETIMSLDPNFGAFNEIVQLAKDSWKPGRVWFPIPQSQIDLNPNLEQNSDY